MNIAIPVWLVAGVVGFAIGVAVGAGGLIGLLTLIARMPTERKAHAVAGGNGRRPRR